MSQDFLTMYRKPQFKINYIPMNSRERASRWGGGMNNSVSKGDFTVEEIESIIRSGELNSLRELSRYFYRTNSRYRNNIDFLASLFLYDTFITPIYDPKKESPRQVLKAFSNACDFIEALDAKNTFTRITREWLKTGIYYGIIQENGKKIVIQDLPIEYCRTRYKDFNNLNILEFDLRFFTATYLDEDVREAAIANFPLAIQAAWKKYKTKKLTDPWVMVPATAGGVTFCFSEDSTPLLIAALPELAKLKDAVGREEKRDENELYKLLIQRMPTDSNGHLTFELDEVAEIHAGVANMLQDLDTVDVLTTFGDTSLENLQDQSASASANNRLEKYTQNVWDSLGTSEVLFNANNSSSLAYAIKRLEAVMRSYLNVYNTWVRYLLNSHFARPSLSFDFQILPTTVFNLKDYTSQLMSGAQFGYSKMMAGIAMGIKQQDLTSMIDFENNILGLSELMKPLQSSYTQSSEKNSNEKNNLEEKNSVSQVQSRDLNNKGGRPELPDEEKSQKTQQNIDSMG